MKQISQACLFSFFLLLLLLSSAGGAYAQTGRILYFDSNGKVTTKAGAALYSILEQDKKDTALFAVSTFLISGSRKENGFYKSIKFPIAWDQLHQPGFTELATKEGLFQEYHENQQLKFSGVFRQGLGEGKHRQWFNSGKLLSESTLVKGKEEGKVVSYSENGKVHTSYNTQNGLLEGELTEYFEDGRKKTKATFHQGKLVGDLTHYDDKGQEVPKKAGLSQN